MTIYWAGSEFDAVIAVQGLGEASQNSGTTEFDPNFSRCAMRIRGEGSHALEAWFPELFEVWVHVVIGFPSPANQETADWLWLGYQDDASSRFIGGSGSITHMRMDAQSRGSSDVELGITADTIGRFGPTQTGSRQNIAFACDFHIVVHETDGLALTEVYVDEVLEYREERANENGSPTRGVNRFAMSGMRSSNDIYYSQVIVADEPTLGWKVLTGQPTANGSQQDFSAIGSPSSEAAWDVLANPATQADNQGSTVDNEYIESTTAGDISYFLTDPLANFTGSPGVTLQDLYEVAAVTVGARVADPDDGGSPSPNNCDVGLRSLGSPESDNTAEWTAVDYISTLTTTTRFNNVGMHVAANYPGTGTAWTFADLDNFEIGVRSAT